MARPVTPKLSIAADDFQRIRSRSGNGSQGMVYQWRSLLGRLTARLNDPHLGSIKPVDLEDFFYGRKGLADKCGPTTLGKYRSDLIQFFNWCHRRGFTPHTGAYLLGDIAEKTTKPNRERFRMNRHQIIALMDAATEPRDRAMIAFAVNTGCRISEVAGMRVKDVRLDREEVYVRLWKTRQEVTIAITADLDTELRSWLTHYGQAMKEPLQPDWTLFPPRHSPKLIGYAQLRRPEGYRPATRVTNARYLIRPIAERAGIVLETGDGWHTLRRSVARLFFDDASRLGFDRALRMTQAFLHHKNASTTEEYLGLDVERAAVDKVLRGQHFITGGLNDGNVTPLRKVG